MPEVVSGEFSHVANAKVFKRKISLFGRNDTWAFAQWRLAWLYRGCVLLQLRWIGQSSADAL
jgi:hypothetical protein